MSGINDTVQRYFGATDSAFQALAQVLDKEIAQGDKENLVYSLTGYHLARLRTLFQCMELQSRFKGTLKIDTNDSGFPLFRQVLEVEQSIGPAEARLRDLPTPAEIRAEMVELMLKYKQFPDALQRSMAERLFYEAIMERKPFTSASRPLSSRPIFNRKSKLPSYVVEWAVYDGAANLPMIYVAEIEDSSGTAAKVEDRKQRGPWDRQKKGEHKSESPRRFPNEALRPEFEKFVATHSSYGLTLATIATTMDKDFPGLHPKQMRRFVLGPFYTGGITRQNEKVQSVLDSVSEARDSWLLTWTMQSLTSKGQESAGTTFWGRTIPKEIYHINTHDIECVQQGASAVEHHALIPHEAYQAVYARGLTDDLFDGYRCHIASGDQILANV